MDSKIYDLSWNKSSFLSKCSLLFHSYYAEQSRIRSFDDRTKAAGYSALSSTCYNIAGTGFAQLRALFRLNWKIIFLPFRAVWFAVSWLPLALWCYNFMLVYSDHTKYISGGYEGMTANECDVRQSILLKRRRFKEAGKCIQAALAKKPTGHALGLLYIGYGKWAAHELPSQEAWRVAEQYAEMALAIAREVRQTEPNQAIRILRGCAELADFYEMGDPIPATQLRHEALELIRSTETRDQLVKL